MATNPIKTRPWDAADHLKDDQDIAAYLDAAFEDGDPQLIAAALGDVARSHGMTRVAARAGLGRESLYKALSPQGNPKFATVVKVMQAMGYRLVRTESHIGQRHQRRSRRLWESAFMRPSRPFAVRAFVGEQRDSASPQQWAYQ